MPLNEPMDTLRPERKPLMHRRLLLLISVLSLVAASCGGAVAAPTSQTPSSSQAASTTATTTTRVTTTSADATAPDIVAFCRATTELNAILLLSAFSSLTGEGAQDLHLLSKLPQLTAASTEMASSAPPEYSGQAATLAAMFETMSDLAEERGLSVLDLADLAADIEEVSLTVDELFEALGIAPADISQLFRDAELAVADGEPPVDLFGADVTDLGCPAPELTASACDLLGDSELVPLVGEGYTKKTTDIERIGEQCTIRGDDNVLIDLTLAGTSFYLPGAWNKIEMVDGLGDEAFITSGMAWPFLYVTQGDTVISLTVANIDPPLTVAQLADLARIALANSGG